MLTGRKTSQFLCFWLTIFSNILKFLVYKSCTSVKFIHKYFTLLEATANGIAFLFSFLDCLLQQYRIEYNISKYNIELYKFYILQPCWTCLIVLIFFWLLRIFCMQYHTICKYRWFYFLSNLDVFIPFSSVIVQDRAFCGRSGPLCHTLDLRWEVFRISSLSISCGFFRDVFYHND